MNLTFPGPISEVIRFDLATLDLELPPTWTLPRDGELRVELSDSATGGVPITAKVPIVEGAPKLADAPLWSAENGRFAIQGLPPGKYVVTVYAVAKGAPEVKTQISSNSWRYSPERVLETTAELTLTSAQRALLRLR